MADGDGAIDLNSLEPALDSVADPEGYGVSALEKETSTASTKKGKRRTEATCMMGCIRDLLAIAGFIVFLGLAIAIMKHQSDEMDTACPSESRRLTGGLTVLNSTPAVYDATDVVVFYTQNGVTARAQISATIPPGEYSAVTSSGDDDDEGSSCTRQWTVREGFYWAIVTCTTVGYGDYSANNDDTKGFLCFYFLFAIAAFGVFVGVINKYLHKAQDAMLQALDDNPDDFDEPQEYKALFSLVLIVITVIIGAVFFQENEGWTFLDAFYWSFITSSTVGYGDMSLTKDSSQTFSIFYVLFAVTLFAFGAENFFGVYEEMQRETKLQQVMMAGLNVEKLLADDPRITSGEYLAAFLKEMGFVTTEDIEPVLNRFKVLDVDKSGFLTKSDIVTPRATPERLLKGSSSFRNKMQKTHEVEDIVDEHKEAIDLLVDEDVGLASSAYNSEAFQYLFKLMVLAFYMSVGAAVMHGEEEIGYDCAAPASFTVGGTTYTQSSVQQCTRPWSWAESFYWASATVTTVGYGDFSPSWDGTKIFVMFYAFVGIPLCAWAISDCGIWVIESLQNCLLRPCATPGVAIDSDGKLLMHKGIINLVILLLTIGIGTIVYALLEEWTFVDALYWSFQTSTTVGYGDQSLTKPESRMFSVFYFLFSNSLVVGAVSQIIGEVLEQKHMANRERVLNDQESLEMIIANDLTGDGRISEAEYLAKFLHEMQLVHHKETTPVIRQFDELDADKSGYLDEDDLLTPAERAAKKASSA